MASYLDVDGYIARAGTGALLPMIEETTRQPDPDDPTMMIDVTTRVVDRGRIGNALADASGVCRGYLPRDLLGPDGQPLDDDALPPRLVGENGALPGVVYALARFQLSDGETGESDIVTRGQKAAIETLKRLANMPERATVVATIEDGVNAGAYIPGIDDAPAGSDYEVLRV